jgi:hypothetical protein
MLVQGGDSRRDDHGFGRQRQLNDLLAEEELWEKDSDPRRIDDVAA